jgi:hypothetical protein
MATLTGNSIASTYTQLLKITSATLGSDTSAKYIEDGLGTDSALSISTTRVGIGTAAPESLLHLIGTSVTGNDNDYNFTLEDDTAYNGIAHSGIRFKAKYNAGGSATELAGISAGKENTTDGNYAGEFRIQTRPNGGNITDRLVINSSGDVTVSTGNLVIGTSGKGIDFSATSDAGGMTSELLDDYEEGTWTPSLLFGGAAVSMTYGTNGLTGTYTKVGNQVTAKGWIQLTAKGSSTGVVTIGGLPFTSLGTARTYSSCSLRMENISFADFPQAFTNVGVTTIFVEELSNAGVLSSLAETDFANNSALMVTVIYTT